MCPSQMAVLTAIVWSLVVVNGALDEPSLSHQEYAKAMAAATASSSGSTQVLRASGRSMLGSWQNTECQQEGVTKTALAQQRDFCTTKYKYPESTTGMQLVPVPGVGNAKIFVYPSGDIVSNNIIGGGWEIDKVNEIVRALEHPLPGGQGNKRPLFVDIGANIGWFTVNMAARGYDVVAFEGMQRNQQMIRSSLCANPQFENVRLHAFGLGKAKSKCYIFSGDTNVGDGHTMCNVADAKEAAKNVPSSYHLRGHMDIETLDSVICQDIKVMKIDVEGFEPWVFAGAQKLLTNNRVWFVSMEFAGDMILTLNRTLKSTDVPTHLEVLHSLKYSISNTSFQGPYLTPSEVKAMSHELGIIELYAVHPDFFDWPETGDKAAELDDSSHLQPASWSPFTSCGWFMVLGVAIFACGFQFGRISGGGSGRGHTRF